MLIKKAKYKKVKTWSRKEVSPEVHACDNCKTVILEDFPNEEKRMDMTVWPDKKGSETMRYHFCSWECCLKFIPKIKSSYFASLPHLIFDSNGKGSATELIKAVNKIQKP